MKNGTRDQEFATLYAKAEAAGRAAGTTVVPDPMFVVERANPLDDASPVTRAYPPVMGGVCGFAWVTVHPGTSAFARWLKKTKRGDKAYGGGICIWIGDYGQSMTRKSAHARAMARILTEAGLTAYAGDRMD